MVKTFDILARSTTFLFQILSYVIYTVITVDESIVCTWVSESAISYH